MRNKIGQFLLIELLVFASLVSGGVAILGGLATWSGDSRHPLLLSWSLVALLACASAVLGGVAVLRFRRMLLGPAS